MEPMKDMNRFYEVQRRQCHVERPGFRISELQLSPTQKVPWHYYSNVQDTFAERLCGAGKACRE
jgi:hypothetical protein